MNADKIDVYHEGHEAHEENKVPPKYSYHEGVKKEDEFLP